MKRQIKSKDVLRENGDSHVWEMSDWRLFVSGTLSGSAMSGKRPQKVNVLIDTGAACSLISHEVLRKLDLKQHSSSREYKIHTIDGSATGKAAVFYDAILHINGIAQAISLVVAEYEIQGTADVILSGEWLVDFILTVNYGNQSFHLQKS